MNDVFELLCWKDEAPYEYFDEFFLKINALRRCTRSEHYANFKNILRSYARKGRNRVSVKCRKNARYVYRLRAYALDKSAIFARQVLYQTGWIGNVSLMHPSQCPLSTEVLLDSFAAGCFLGHLKFQTVIVYPVRGNVCFVNYICHKNRVVDMKRHVQYV